jgi:hypothetical protein
MSGQEVPEIEALLAKGSQVVMRRLCVLAAAGALTACAAPAGPPSPGGGLAHLIECPEGSGSIEDCRAEASDQCPTGFSVIDSQEVMGPATDDPDGGRQQRVRSIIVQCAR